MPDEKSREIVCIDTLSHYLGISIDKPDRDDKEMDQIKTKLEELEAIVKKLEARENG